MKSILKHCFFVFLMTVLQSAKCQTAQLWTQQNRLYLIENLERTKLEIVKATKDISALQWAYKEDSAKWSISQVVEHLGLYERIFGQEADIMLSMPADPLLDCLSKRTARI